MAPEGTILLTEEKVDIEVISRAISVAFAKRYPNVKVMVAEKQTNVDGKVTYELGFWKKGKKSEATFAENGTFISQE